MTHPSKLALWLALLLAPAAVAEDLSDEVRKELVDLPRLYRGAADQATRVQLLERAREIGPKGVARLRPVVEGQMGKELARYQPLFQRALTVVASQPDVEISTMRVLASSPPLAEQRKRLLEVVALADILGPPERATGAAAEPYAKQLEVLEKGALEQAVLARSMQSLDAQERLVVKRINQERANRGLPALRVDPALCRASKGHSYDMQKHGFFSHESPLPGKRSFAERARLAGTRANAENIAQTGSGEAAMRMWMKSDGHRRNILSETRRLGVGRAGNTFTTMFGR